MIREMHSSIEEMNDIMDIWLASTIEAHPFISKEYWEKNYEIVKTQYLPHSDTYVYEESGKIVGFISIIDQAFIGALFVNIEKQRSGIGKALIRFAMDNYSSLSLAVYVENEKAVAFYKTMGFDIIQEQLNDDSKVLEYIMGVHQ